MPDQFDQMMEEVTRWVVMLVMLVVVVMMVVMVVLVVMVVMVAVHAEWSGVAQARPRAR